MTTEPEYAPAVLKVSTSIRFMLRCLAGVMSGDAVVAGQCEEEEVTEFVNEWAAEMIAGFIKALNDKGFVLKGGHDA
jgi:hypothetical protein